MDAPSAIEESPLTLALTAGVRVADVRLDVTYEPRRRGAGDFTYDEDHVTARARAVLAQRVDLLAEFHHYGAGSASGASAFGGLVGAAWYPTRTVGLRVELFYAPVSVWTGSLLTERAFGGALRVSWWFAPRVGLAVSYAPTLESDAAQSYVRHAIHLGATARFHGW